MKCGHAGCLCNVEQGQEFCSDHCREHASGRDHLEHACECGHDACNVVGE
jgi:hypothetical protein